MGAGSAALPNAGAATDAEGIAVRAVRPSGSRAVVIVARGNARTVLAHAAGSSSADRSRPTLTLPRPTAGTEPFLVFRADALTLPVDAGSTSQIDAGSVRLRRRCRTIWVHSFAVPLSVDAPTCGVFVVAFEASTRAAVLAACRLAGGTRQHRSIAGVTAGTRGFATLGGGTTIRYRTTRIATRTGTGCCTSIRSARCRPAGRGPTGRAPA